MRYRVPKMLIMNTKNAQNEKPDFSTLSKIMERFKAVPYNQFQQELDAWFSEGMRQQGKVDTDYFSQLKILTSSIYHHAEVMELLKDLKTGGSND